MNESFVFGVQYYRSPTPKEENWETDLRRIKENGFNTIKVWIAWAWVEPSSGEFRFKDFDKIFDMAEKCGLKVVPLITLNENAPFWIERLYPDSGWVSSEGKVIRHRQPREHCTVGLCPGPCLDHPGVRKRAETFLNEVAKRYKDRKNLLVWDCWNEVWWYEGGGLGCYCSHTISKYRKWLEEKYGSLNGLNKAWNRIYGDWEDVYPPHSPRRHYPDMIDWRLFSHDLVAEEASFRVNSIRSIDNKHSIMLHTGGSCLWWEEKLLNGNDDWKLAETVDLYGSSFFPDWMLPGQMLPGQMLPGHGISIDDYSFMLDGLRSASGKKPYWISELQAGPANKGLWRMKVPTPEDQKIWIFSAISKGAKGVLFWQWRPELVGLEAPGHGLTETDGSSNERTKMAKSVAGIISKNEMLFSGARVPASEVAIIFDPEIYLLDWVAHATSRWAINSTKGYYFALWENNIQCDILHRKDMENLNKYKLVILPYPILIKNDTAKKIKDYVGNGGMVLAEAYCGAFNDEYLFSTTIPGNGLDKLFCAKESSLEVVGKVLDIWGEKAELGETKIEITKRSESLKFLKRGDALKGVYFKESFKSLKNGDVLGRFDDGKPALIMGRFGKGKTLLIGTFLGLSFHEHREMNLRRLIKSIANYAGVDMTFEIKTDNGSLIEARILKGDNYMLLFLFNHGEAGEVSCELMALSGQEVKELTGKSNFVVGTSADRIKIKTSISKDDVKIFLIR